MYLKNKISKGGTLLFSLHFVFTLYFPLRNVFASVTEQIFLNLCPLSVVICFCNTNNYSWYFLTIIMLQNKRSELKFLFELKIFFISRFGKLVNSGDIFFQIDDVERIRSVTGEMKTASCFVSASDWNDAITHYHTHASHCLPYTGALFSDL